MSADLQTAITYLKGVGPARAETLGKELHIYTYNDLLYHFPFRYVDRSHLSQIATLDIEQPFVVLRGIIRDMHTVTSGRVASRLEALFDDGTGQMVLVWFQGVKWVREMLKTDVPCLVMGKPGRFGSQLQMSHPDIEPLTQGDRPGHQFMPVYSTTEKGKAHGITSKALAHMVDTLFSQLDGQVAELLPDEALQRYRLMPRHTALRAIHFPRTAQEMQQAILRMKFEELFLMQLEYQYSRVARRRLSQGYRFNTVGDNLNRFFHEKMPFEMTGAQKRVVHEIWNDMRSGRQMNRLLQGDVGSGKTLVALLTMLLAVDNGYQACLMAPTEILATQHYANFERLLDGMGLRVALLIGSLKAADKRLLKQRLKSGDIDLLVGTHALIERDVHFARLGYVVIDEQHRFGVEQRSRLWGKSAVAPHILVMTATPIPRTLAMTLYGDLECSVIDELPPGRQPVRTLHGTDAQRLKLFDFMRRQIDAGRQVYVVYPLINESEKSDLKDLMDGYESLSRAFPMPRYRLSIVHGQMDAAAKAYEMDCFKRGVSHIMVATTVIEVGVDVPNATMMVIENAERFGLSQLHQLRGRVGRGGGAAYCVLMTRSDLSKTARERISTMCGTTDGFKIAEADLKLRGPGDMQGLRQSGLLELRLTDLVDDEPVVRAARDMVGEILDIDPELTQYPMLRRYIAQHTSQQQWGKIS
ncbi:MAG: ATP-dependent DNA helicase RecG [bacterium P3]|nr:MAG: ATP-dependent DNA helicase RecG [bacterium P3]KWW40672.1 MAG: ATP-dependent DNA helicase RecG [bacterium F083]